MSMMKTSPVLICRRCGRGYTFSLKTTEADPEGKVLHELMQGVMKESLCDVCTAQRTWYIQQNRAHDWDAGRP